MTLAPELKDASKLQLIVVDDHRRAREALARRLAVHPLAAVAGHTNDIVEAHEMVASRHPHVALIDPGRSADLGHRGVASLAALPPSHRPLIVVHASYFHPDDWIQARAAGADDFILKHIGVDALVSSLLKLVRANLPPDRWPGLLHS